MEVRRNHVRVSLGEARRIHGRLGELLPEQMAVGAQGSSSDAAISGVGMP